MIMMMMMISMSRCHCKIIRRHFIRFVVFTTVYRSDMTHRIVCISSRRRRRRRYYCFEIII